MKKFKIVCLTCLVLLISQTMVNAATVVIYPDEYPYALRNPLMGFRPDTSAGSSYSGDPYATVTRCYIRWNELENYESDTIDKIKTVCNTKWRDAEKYNVKVIPRVFLDWDSDPGNEYWPADMTAGDYSSEQFKTRLRRLIQRLGQCWDKDPRVAWVQMGIVGLWGEHHSPSPTAEIQQLMGEEFTAAFPNKKVLVRRPWETFTNFQFGGYWDSWANWGQMEHGTGIDNLNDATQRWKVNVFEGEIAYNCCDYQIQPGDSPDHTLTDSAHLDFLLDTIRNLHCSGLGWISGYTKTDPAVVIGAEEVQKAFGYRYLLSEVSYPDTLTPGASFSVQFKVTNVGSTPFHYNWPVEISLLNPATKAVVWHDTFDGCDIRNWLPGDQYNTTTNVYTVPAVVNTVNGTFQLPSGIANGEYIIALAILDPGGMLPAARFSTVNYFNGGRHPIGYTGVNVIPSQTQLSSGLFNDPANDNSLYYSLTRTPPQVPGGIDVQAENYTAMSGIQVGSTTDTGGGQSIGYIENGDWAQYSINVPAAGSYPVDFRVATATSGGTINMVVGGSTIGSAAVTGTGGWNNWTTVRTTATFSAAGSQTLRLNFVGASGYLYNINWFKVITNLDTTAPVIPTGLVATAGDEYVFLDWADSADAGLWVYGVYRARTPGGPYTHVQDVFTSDWADYGVTIATTYYYVVTAMDICGNESGYSNEDSAAPFTLSQPPSFTVDPINEINAADGLAYSSTIADNASDPENDPMAFSKVSGPAWLTVAANGTLGGTPSAGDVGLNVFTVQVAAIGGTDTAVLNITVNATSIIHVEAEGYTAMSGIQSETTTDTGGGQNVGWIENGDWAQYSINVPSAGTCAVAFRVASGGAGGTINMVVGGSTVGSVAVANTGGWQTWTTVSTTATFTAAGTQTVRLNFVGGTGYLFNLNWFELAFTTAPDTTPPAAPTGLVATPGAGQVSLDWANNTEPDLASYGVFRAATAGGPYTHLLNVTASSHIDTGVVNGTTYYYVVTAIDTSNNESYASNEVSATPQAVNQAPTVSITTPLNGQTFPAGSNVNVEATASDSDGSIANVKLYRNGQFVRQEGTAPYQWGASDPLLQNLSEGSYVLEAVATDNLGATANNSITIYVIAPPAAPVGLTATAGNSSVSLDWADNTEPDLASYNVKRATVLGGPYTTIAAGVVVSAYTDNTVTNGTTYYYVVSAVDTGSNESVNSSQVSATPHASAPTFVAAGAVASGTGTITPALPSGISSGDILLLFAETSNQAISISNSNGGSWAQVTNSPQGTGTAAATSAARLTVFWSRYNGTQGVPTLSDSGNHQIGRMIAIRGAAASGNPWDVTAGGVEATSDTSGSIPGATTTVANTLVVVAAAGSLPDATGTSNFSAWTNANLTSLTERIDNTQNPGNGGALGIATGVKSTAGAYGNTAVTHASAATKGMISIAIKP